MFVNIIKIAKVIADEADQGREGCAINYYLCLNVYSALLLSSKVSVVNCGFRLLTVSKRKEVKL